MSELARLYEQALQGVVPTLTPQTSRLSLWNRWRLRKAVDHVDKAVGAYLRTQANQLEPEEQGTVVRDLIARIVESDSYNGVREKQEVTFEILRRLAHHCEPLIAIINRRCLQVAAFGQVSEFSHGYVKKPGFRIRMTVGSQEATAADKRRIEELQQFILNCGFCDPPRNERPDGWQPGFTAFLEQITRDTLTLDWVTFRRWRADPQTDPKGRYKIVAFAAVDSARIRRVRRKPVRVINGVQQTADWEGERANTNKEIVFVRMSSPGIGGVVEEEYTADEMVALVRNPCTDEGMNGYGYSETERCVHAITAWIWSRDYNMSRFRTDALPRGILAVLGQLNQQQFDMFKLDWMSMLKGVGKRWNIPILRGLPQAGSAVNWIPFDLSSRDMEYHQFLFSCALWMHAIFGIHPEETGFEALSPFRPPLSEASPEFKLKYSQDSSFSPLLRWIQDFVNREILWVLVPDRRYTFEFVGVGDVDQMQDVEFRAALLQSGLTTPRMQWNELDVPIPESLKEHPAWDLPMPFAEGVQLILTLQQAQLQMQQAQGQQQMAQQSAMQQSASASALPGAPSGAFAGGGGGLRTGAFSGRKGSQVASPDNPTGGPPGVLPGAGQPVREGPPGTIGKALLLRRKRRIDYKN
jgi:hypothetical protein